jgi:recombination protein RecA
MVSAVGAVSDAPELEYFSTGSVGLDLALGGGWPKGYISEIHGPTACGKTTLVHATIERVAGSVLLVDHDGDYPRLKSEPVITRSLEAVRMAFARGIEFDLVVFDGIPHQDTVKEIEALLSDYPCTALCVTQEREQIVSRGRSTVSIGPTGGWLSEPSVRVRLSPGGDGYTQAEVQRNVFRCPVYQPVYFLAADSSIDTSEELLSLGVLAGYVRDAGSKHYWLGEDYLGHGGGRAVASLNRRPDLAEHLLEKLLDHGELPW